MPRTKTSRAANGEGSTYFDRGRGRWVAELTVTDSATGELRRRRVIAATQGEVVARKAELQALALGLATPAAPPRPGARARTVAMADTVDALFDAWLVDVRLRTRRPSTTGDYEVVVRKYLRPAMGHLPLAALVAVPYDLRTLLEEVAQEAGLVDSRRLRRTLSVALTYAVERGLLDRNPLIRMTFDRAPRRREIPTEADVTGLVTLVDEGFDFGPLIAVALGTGLAPGELYGLHWGDVHIDDRYLDVTHTKVKVKGVVPEVKRRSRYRRVPLGAVALAGFERQRALQATWRAARPLDHARHERALGGLVFTTPRTGAPLVDTSTAGRIRKFQERHGVARGKTVRLKDMRAAFGTALGDSQVEQRIISRLMGHADLRVTDAYYQGAMPKAAAQAVAVLDRTYGHAGAPTRPSLAAQLSDEELDAELARRRGEVA